MVAAPDSNLLTFLGYVRRKFKGIRGIDVHAEQGVAQKIIIGPRPRLEVGWQRTLVLPQDQTRERRAGASTRIGRLALWVHIMVGIGDPDDPDPVDRALALTGTVMALTENGKFERSGDTVRVQQGLSSCDGAVRISDPAAHGLPDDPGIVHMVVMFSVPVKLDALTEQPAPDVVSEVEGINVEVQATFPRFTR